jgi:hypothetical protein
MDLRSHGGIRGGPVENGLFIIWFVIVIRK